MSTVKVSRDLLIQALEGIIANKSFGVADVNIRAIRGVILSGEAFEIESLELDVARKPQNVVAPPRHTAPAGVGKIRLAAVDGERVPQ